MDSMEKLIRRFEVPFIFDHWTYGVEIKKLKEDLETLEGLGVTHVDIEAEDNYGCAYIYIKAIQERVETKKEFEERVGKLKEYEEAQERRELEVYNKLKAKYDGKHI